MWHCAVCSMIFLFANRELAGATVLHKEVYGGFDEIHSNVLQWTGGGHYVTSNHVLPFCQSTNSQCSTCTTVSGMFPTMFTAIAVKSRCTARGLIFTRTACEAFFRRPSFWRPSVKTWPLRSSSISQHVKLIHNRNPRTHKNVPSVLSR